MKIHSIKKYIYLLALVAEVSAQDTSWVSLKKASSKSSTLKPVYVDNSYIQSYNSRLGVWEQVKNQKEFHYFCHHYSASIKEVLKINNYPDFSQSKKNLYLFFPFSEQYIQELQEANIERYAIDSRQGEFIWPIMGVRITSRLGRRWGRYHNGLDIAAAIGTPVVAAKEGIVNSSSYRRGYGITIELGHENFFITRYAHMDAALVRKGDYVKKGQLIGYSGNTGRSTGPHLHFEVRCGGIVLDPEKFLPGFEKSMESALEFNSFLEEKFN